MNKLYRRSLKCFIMFWGCMLLAACGAGETMPPSPSGEEDLSFITAIGGEGIEIKVERTDLYNAAPELKGKYDTTTIDDGKCLGLQFYQGEPVQLWTSAVDLEKDLQEVVSVYMYRQDGTRDICLEQIERSSANKIVFRDSRDCCYLVDPGVENDKITKLDSTGKSLYTVNVEGDYGKVRRICELADGRLAVLVCKPEGYLEYGLILLDDKGKITTVELSEQFPPGQSCYIGTSEEGLLFMTGEQLYRVGLPDGKLEPMFSFVQTAYSAAGTLELVTFRMRGDGKLDVLREGLQGGRVCETLRLEEKNENRQDVVLRGLYVKNNRELKELALRFNSSNDRYRVVIEGPEGDDDLDDYIARTGVELATGKGPDILTGTRLLESPADLIEKGILADLAPLMEQSGIKEEDYFPMAFSTWRTGDSIYAIRNSGDCEERLMSSAVLGEAEPSDIEAVADALLAYPENATYDGRSSANNILRDMLEGSETLWGMVDWEKGTCDFSGELFRKLLEVAKRYQYDERFKYPSVCSKRYFISLFNVYDFPMLAQVKAQGKVAVGRFFDDGAHPTSLADNSFAINANAANKEGAWEFLQFLLSEEAQRSMLAEFDNMTVKKSAYWSIVEGEILNGPTDKSIQRMFRDSPLTMEKAEEIAALMEDTCALPYKTEVILGIVLEEAQGYFDGSMEISQVVDKIDNRVGLYLKERK